jgi:hypothetical protein
VLLLNNVTTTDSYEDCELGPVPTAEKVLYLVANNPVLAQAAPTAPSKTVQPWGPDILITPQSAEFQRTQGMRFKSAVSGSPAQVIAILIEPGDILPIGGTPFTGALTPGGSVTPGGGNVQVQKNGALIGTESILDFAVDGRWAVADDPANTRIVVTAPQTVTGLVLAAGGIAGGSGFTVAHPAAGVYTITFGPVFVSRPLVIATADQNIQAIATIDNGRTWDGTQVSINTWVGAVLTNANFAFYACLLV